MIKTVIKHYLNRKSKVFKTEKIVKLLGVTIWKKIVEQNANSSLNQPQVCQYPLKGNQEVEIYLKVQDALVQGVLNSELHPSKENNKN